MKKIEIIEGQINLFDIPVQDPIKTKETITRKQEIKGEIFEDIISKYNDVCNRIVRIVSGALLIELDEKTMYFNGQGVYEFDLGTNVGLTPGDEILLVNKDKELNNMQLKKLEEINPESYIKRKGDSNIIIPSETKTIVINPNGWVIEWLMKPVFKNYEVINNIEVPSQDEALQIGDTVEFKYDSEKCNGKIASIYNNGETVNVVWDHKYTAFYYKCLRKVV